MPCHRVPLVEDVVEFLEIVRGRRKEESKERWVSGGVWGPSICKLVDKVDSFCSIPWGEHMDCGLALQVSGLCSPAESQEERA